jgi:hypothetical protein
MRSVNDFLELARKGHNEAALQGLIDLGEPAIELLSASYRGESSASVRALIVEAVWQIRSHASVDFLGEALLDPAPEVWRQALDGLVTLASAQSLQILESTRDQLGDNRPELGDWLDGAIDDVRGRVDE